MPSIFVENMIFFWDKCSHLTFCNGIKMFVANKVLFIMNEEKLLELLTLVIAFVHWIYIYIYYGVSIGNKHSSIVNIKEGISNRHGVIENGKIFWRENFTLTFHICDNIYPSQLLLLLLFIYFSNWVCICDEHVDRCK